MIRQQSLSTLQNCILHTIVSRKNLPMGKKVAIIAEFDLGTVAIKSKSDSLFFI